MNSLQNTSTGLTAKLELAGPACNAFGTDIVNLTIEVSYETQTRFVPFPVSPLCPISGSLHLYRLHVNIFDSANQQFRVPDTVVSRPPLPGNAHSSDSDLAFNFDPNPFEFWITRRSDPDGTPLFDTRKASLPTTPITPVIPNDNSTALDGFPLVFEDQYLQVSSLSCDKATI